MKHETQMKLMLKDLSKTKLQKNIRKCEFLVQRMKYLNFIIEIDDIKMNSKKIKINKN